LWCGRRNTATGTPTLPRRPTTCCKAAIGEAPGPPRHRSGSEAARSRAASCRRGLDRAFNRVGFAWNGSWRRFCDIGVQFRHPTLHARCACYARTGGTRKKSRHSRVVYLATYSLLMSVPIALKVVTISFAEVSRKNLSELLAQFCNSVEVGSPLVFTWMV